MIADDFGPLISYYYGTQLVLDFDSQGGVIMKQALKRKVEKVDLTPLEHTAHPHPLAAVTSPSVRIITIFKFAPKRKMSR